MERARTYLRRAEEIRTIADSVKDTESREKLYRVVAEYEEWARTYLHLPTS